LRQDSCACLACFFPTLGRKHSLCRDGQIPGDARLRVVCWINPGETIAADTGHRYAGGLGVGTDEGSQQSVGWRRRERWWGEIRARTWLVRRNRYINIEGARELAGARQTQHKHHPSHNLTPRGRVLGFSDGFGGQLRRVILIAQRTRPTNHLTMNDLGCFKGASVSSLSFGWIYNRHLIGFCSKLLSFKISRETCQSWSDKLIADAITTWPRGRRSELLLRPEQPDDELIQRAYYTSSIRSSSMRRTHAALAW